jgi:hypothetical protein
VHTLLVGETYRVSRERRRDDNVNTCNHNQYQLIEANTALTKYTDVEQKSSNVEQSVHRD